VKGIGVLALQGDFEKHAQRLREIGCQTALVKREEECENLSGLIIPGGESTTLLRLLGPEFVGYLKRRIREGLPVFGTCAGAILLARAVNSPSQPCFGVIDIDVTRNAYGRQVDSFIESKLGVTRQGRELLFRRKNGHSLAEVELEGVFIRAPRISRVGPSVTVLARREEEAVLVLEKNVLVAAFHPELSRDCFVIHEFFAALAERTLSRPAVETRI